MAFLSRFFTSPERKPLPTLDAILTARKLTMDLPGLEALKEEFPHLNETERNQWGDALQELVARGWPLPALWLDAQYELSPRLVPGWVAERDGFFYRPFIDGLALRMVVGGQTMPAAWLTLWGVTWEDVLDRSMEQLRERSLNTPFQRQPTGIYRGVFADGQSASRFLLPELWHGLFQGQNTFIAIPSEDELLVAPQVLLPQLVEAISKSLAGSEPRLVGTIYQQVGENFLPATLQDPHPIAQPQRELRQADMIEAYKAQESELSAELGVPAPAGVVRTQQGRSISYTTWQEGQPVLLPETDLVGFVAASGRPMGIYFRQTMPRISEIHGTTVDIWGPRRIRYDTFPTVAQLSRLECFATGEQMADLFKGSSPSPARPRPVNAPMQDRASSGARSAQASSPVPAHLRGLSLGVQSDDE
jgi:hypothetical protein